MKRVLCPIAILIICLTSSVSAQERKLLSQRIPSIELGSKSVSEVLSCLAENYQIPIADEASSQTTNEIVDTSIFVLKNKTVKTILTTLFANRPDYHWVIEDGVVSISSSSQPEALFDTAISEFSVKNQTVSEIKKALTARPEIQLVLLQTNSEFAEMTILPGNDVEPTGKYTFTLHQATVRQILNRLIVETPGHYWTMVKFGNHDKFWIIVR